MKRKQVIIGFLGTNLDYVGKRQDRWSRWRPTVSMVQHEDFLVDRIDLIHEERFDQLAKQVTGDIQSVSPETSVHSHHCCLKDAWDFEDVFGMLYDFATNYHFDTDKEDYYIHITTGTHVAQICLFLLTETRHFPAKLLQTSPPHKHSQSPGGISFIDLDLSRYDKLAQRFNLEQTDSQNFLKQGIATRNKTFNQLIEHIEHVSMHSNDPMLLTGSTGVGKSKLAEQIYELKKRRRQMDGQFVALNCATIRSDTAMSTLFGHRKGAFTGAVSHRPGLLMQADGGLLFLDEVGELGVDEQGMLLRAIENKTFLPVGADTESRSDFQLICGTNRDLAAEVRKGRFREDLLARINLWTFTLPNLAQRRDDIEPNIAFELEQLARSTGSQMRFNKQAMTAYMTFARSPLATWQANFRDLNASIRRMATMSPSGRITLEVVNDEIARLKTSWAYAPGEDTAAVLHDVMDEKQLAQLDLFDRMQLAQVLGVCRKAASLSDAGRQLFANTRNKRKSVNDADRLRKYLAKFNLKWADLQQD
jgi:transcriptional regulatory protein RtcR